MSNYKTLKQVEEINKLISEYKKAKRLYFEIIPNLKEQGIYTVFSESLPYNEEIAAEITKSGQKHLMDLIVQLKQYGIDVEFGIESVNK